MNEHNNEASKQLLLEFLDFFRYKIENDLLTMGEVESLAKAISERVLLLVTIDDFAQFYEQSHTNMSSVIKRRMIPKPVRRVYYPFNVFSKIVPQKWHEKIMTPYRPLEKKKQ
jgi:hypothetical protein